MLGETQKLISDEAMQIDQNGDGGQPKEQLNYRFVEPYVYTLYRTEQPRCLENQYRLPTQNKEMEIRASGGLLKNPMSDSNIGNWYREKQLKMFRQGLIL
jgi:hypothetical protein